jgi:rare lipoprotein A
MMGLKRTLLIPAFVWTMAAILSTKALAQSETNTFESAFAEIEPPSVPLQPENDAVNMADLVHSAGTAGQVIQDLGGGVASYYGRRFHGRLTANGETFDMNALTAAHPSLPFGTMVRVTNPRNSRSVIVRINDRGPFVAGRVIDLSRAAAKEIGLIRRGHAQVRLELVAS